MNDDTDETEQEREQRMEKLAQYARMLAIDARDRARMRDAPDLQEFIRARGGYANVTPEAWAEWDAMVAAYHARKWMR
jgi:hypothetical protein